MPDRYGIVDGEVTFGATDPPWRSADGAGSSRTMSTLLREGVFGGIKVLADPLPVGTGCEADAVPADADACAQRILSDPDVDATDPVRIAGKRPCRWM